MSGEAKRTAANSGDRDQLVAAYKALLQEYIDRRPSGMRQKIASAIGKHKSFVSQITNPSYPIPVPARHLETIFEICHFSGEERSSFLAVYREAHPSRTSTVAPPTKRAVAQRSIRIELPAFDDVETERQVERMIRQFARHVIELARKRT